MLTLTIARSESPEATPLGPADPQVQTWRGHDGSVGAYGYTLGGEHWLVLPALGTFRFGAGDGVRAFPQAAVPDALVEDAYRRVVLPIALQALGQEVLHASAVRLPTGVLGLCGLKAAGKSTIAYGLSRRRFPLWADDALAFEVTPRDVRAIPLPFAIRLRPASAAFFGRQAADPQPASVPAAAPLAALCVLERRTGPAGVSVDVTRLPPAAALTAVLAHAYCFNLRDLERKRSMLTHYLQLAARIPVFGVRFGGGLEHLPLLLDHIERAVVGIAALAAVEGDAAGDR